MPDRKKDDFTSWFEAQLSADAKFNQRVEHLLEEMRLEQDLIALREAKGISQTQLAKTLGVSQPAIAKLESGKTKNLELRTLVRAVSALGGKVEIRISTPAGVSRKQGKAKKRVA